MGRRVARAFVVLGVLVSACGTPPSTGGPDASDAAPPLDARDATLPNDAHDAGGMDAVEATDADAGAVTDAPDVQPIDAPDVEAIDVVDAADAPSDVPRADAVGAADVARVDAADVVDASRPVCVPPSTMCGTTCADTTSDPAHCGDCATACPMPANSMPWCAGGRCGFNCTGTFSDCDHNPSNGCETELGTIANCGTCGAACATDPHGTAACTFGVCSLTCASGYMRMGSGCVVSPPRAIAPLSTSTVTSQRPTLRWLAAVTGPAAELDLCRDVACASVISTTVVVGTSWRPATALAPGEYYWRLRGNSGGTATTMYGPTWVFHVGARSTAVDSSWGTTFDDTLDGFADVLVGAFFESPQGTVSVFRGSRTGTATTRSIALAPPEIIGLASAFGFSAASAGDVNGDGYPDVIAGTVQADRAYLYYGGPGGISMTGAVTLHYPGTDGGSYFGQSVSGAGDVNGDGYADVIVGAPRAAGFNGTAYIYLGGPGAFATMPAITIPDAAGSGAMFGYAVASAGDVNGDGYGDVVIGAPEYSPVFGPGWAFVFLGGPGAFRTTPATTFTSSAGDVGIAVVGAGDINGDGYADVALGRQSPMTGVDGAALVFAGSAAGVGSTPAYTMTSPDHGPSFGNSIAGAGDVDGDGYGDLIVGERVTGSTPMNGNAYVYRGGAAALGDATRVSYANVGWVVGGVGDTDGDGYADVAVGEPDLMPESARVYAGSATGVGASPRPVLPNPSSPGDRFGACVQ